MKGNRSLTIDEIHRIMELNENQVSIRDKALFVLMVNTAMRISETLSLKIGDVSDSRGVIHHYLELQACNTKRKQGGAIIPLNDTARMVLNDYVKNLLAMGLTMDDALFGGRVGQYKKPITRYHAHNIFKNIYEIANIKSSGDLKLATHTPRKTAIAFLYENTKDLPLAKNLLRHKTITGSVISYIDFEIPSQEKLDNSFLNLDSIMRIKQL